MRERGLDKGNSKSKGQGVGLCLVGSGYKMASMVGVRNRGKEWEEMRTEVAQP